MVEMCRPKVQTQLNATDMHAEGTIAPPTRLSNFDRTQPESIDRRINYPNNR